MKQKHRILLFCMIIVGKGAFCQLSSQFRNQIHTNNKLIVLKARPKINPAFTILPPNFYTLQVGFFCKEELRLEKAVKIPLKFRLGSIQYNDWMEGKKNAGVLPY